LGKILALDFLANGWQVIVLSRKAHQAGTTDIRFEYWDGVTQGDWSKSLEDTDVVVNLTGRSVNCRHDMMNRAEILGSRVRSVEAIGTAIATCKHSPELWIQAGSLAIYGDAGDRLCNESATHGGGFLVEVCEEWERVFRSVELPGTRKVLLRLGLVLGANGGVLEPLVTLTRRFLGGTVGSGRQHLSWIHAEDFARIVRWCIENDRASGVYNATGLASATNAEFMWALRHALGRPWAPPTPTWLVHLGARMVLKTEAELALTGRRGFPLRLAREGFEFKHTDLTSTLNSVL
jgi:uncharacterized protein (TIGR01777 family)